MFRLSEAVAEEVLVAVALQPLLETKQAAGAGAGAAVVTPEMRVGLEAQEERAEQEPPKHLTAYL